MRFVIQPFDYENAFDSVWQSILGDPGATSWSDGIFTGESLQQVLSKWCSLQMGNER